MTKAEWLCCTEHWKMDRFLGARRSPRKRRLLACAYCRQVWHLVADDRARRAVEVAERLADGLATVEECAAAAFHPAPLGRTLPFDSPILATHRAEIACGFALERRFYIADFYAGGAAWTTAGSPDAVAALQAAAVRELFNPFGPATCDPKWRTEDTVGLARRVYEERAFDRMPLLADALMDAGCEDEQVLGHCRSQGPHYLGCWVIDLILDCS